METPEQFFEQLRSYKRHVLFVALGAAFVVVAMLGSIFDSSLRGKFWGICLLLSGVFVIIGGRIGLRSGRTVLTGWIVAGQDGDAGLGFGEAHSTQELEQMTPHDRIAFAKRSNIFLMVAGMFEMALGLGLLVLGQ
ncbi:MAG: hypothetical protein ABI183_01015 [Polyangiaceae bacterium]